MAMSNTQREVINANAAYAADFRARWHRIPETENSGLEAARRDSQSRFVAASSAIHQHLDDDEADLAEDDASG